MEHIIKCQQQCQLSSVWPKQNPRLMMKNQEFKLVLHVAGQGSLFIMSAKMEDTFLRTL